MLVQFFCGLPEAVGEQRADSQQKMAGIAPCFLTYFVDSQTQSCLGLDMLPKKNNYKKKHNYHIDPKGSTLICILFFFIGLAFSVIPLRRPPVARGGGLLRHDSESPTATTTTTTTRTTTTTTPEPRAECCKKKIKTPQLPHRP